MCGTRLDHTYDQFVCPLVLVVQQDQLVDKKIAILRSVSDTLLIGDVNYKLSACSYGNHGHFVAMVRGFSSGYLYYCDGIENNA